MELTKYLVVNGTSGDCRVVNREPAPKFGEFVYRLFIEIPDSWQEVAGDIDMVLPGRPETEIKVTEDW